MPLATSQEMCQRSTCLANSIPMRSVPEHHCFKVLSEKSQRRIQLYLLKSSPNTATTFFSKMYKISSRNVSPSAGVHWHGSYSNARCTSHFIRTHGKTLRATQSANLNLEMTEILNRQEKKLVCLEFLA